jgi:hypothetical protein
MSQNSVIFTSKNYSEENGQWEVNCSISIGSDNRSGLHVSSLPPEATEQELAKDILKQYGAT